MSLKKLTSIAAAAFVLLAIAIPVSASATSAHDCPGNPQGTGYAPRNDRGIPNYVSSVRNISCNRAGWGAVEHGSLTGSGNLRTAGWSCYVLKRYRSFGTLLGANVLCARWQGIPMELGHVNHPQPTWSVFVRRNPSSHAAPVSRSFPKP